MKKDRIFLSPPHVNEREGEEIARVLESGWVAPAGSPLSAFEKSICERLGFDHTVVLNSGTSALHLSIILSGIKKGDKVLIGSFTFIAAANAVLYEGGVPVFVDSENDTWNADPQLVEARLAEAQKNGESIKAVLVTHLYGMPARIEEIARICDRYNVVLIEDAAEAVGATVDGVGVGSHGRFAVLSFNGNKIITTSGGGALACKNKKDGERALYLAEQAKDSEHYYHHSSVGYNYRLSSVLAALGMAQLRKLDQYLDRKRFIYNHYKQQLEKLGVFEFLDEPTGYISNRWLTTMLVSSEFVNQLTPHMIIKELADQNIEARRLWKPLHLQPLFKDSEYVGSVVAEDKFIRGVCLPSGVGLQKSDQDRIIAIITDLVASRGLLE